MIYIDIYIHIYYIIISTFMRIISTSQLTFSLLVSVMSIIICWECSGQLCLLVIWYVGVLRA